MGLWPSNTKCWFRQFSIFALWILMVSISMLLCHSGTSRMCRQTSRRSWESSASREKPHDILGAFFALWILVVSISMLLCHSGTSRMCRQTSRRSRESSASREKPHDILGAWWCVLVLVQCGVGDRSSRRCGTLLWAAGGGGGGRAPRAWQGISEHSVAVEHKQCVQSTPNSIQLSVCRAFCGLLSPQGAHWTPC